MAWQDEARHHGWLHAHMHPPISQSRRRLCQRMLKLHRRFCCFSLPHFQPHHSPNLKTHPSSKMSSASNSNDNAPPKDTSRPPNKNKPTTSSRLPEGYVSPAFDPTPDLLHSSRLLTAHLPAHPLLSANRRSLHRRRRAVWQKHLQTPAHHGKWHPPLPSHAPTTHSPTPSNPAPRPGQPHPQRGLRPRPRNNGEDRAFRAGRHVQEYPSAGHQIAQQRLPGRHLCGLWSGGWGGWGRFAAVCEVQGEEVLWAVMPEVGLA